MAVDPGTTRLVLLAAMAENGVIGRDGGLPWRLRSELKHFRATSWGKPVVMGRRTYLALPPGSRPLPGRTNIVVSGNPDFHAAGAIVASDLERALAVAHGDALRRGTREIIIAGGAQVYAQTLMAADEIVLTLVHCRPEGDAVFPPIDPDLWQEGERLDRAPGEGDETGFTIVRYRRARNTGEAHSGEPCPRA
jgi:dihydrofolate reductase